jgi:flagellar FliJ protein
MPFRFRLQPVLDYRAKIAEERLRELALAERAYHDTLAAMRRLEDERDATNERFRAPGTQSASTLQICNAYLERIKAAMEHQRGVIAAAEAEVKRAHEAARAATLDKKVLEVLKARKRAEYEEWVALLENRDLDESNIFLNETRRRARREAAEAP